MQQKRPLHLGLLFAEDSPQERIPIYGVDQVDLESRALWETRTLGLQAPAMMIWRGDDVRGYQFNFELFAGVEGAEVFPATRQDLVDYMKWLHSWNAHDASSGEIAAPAAVRLVLGDYINIRGIIKNARTSAKPPWGGITSDDVQFDVGGTSGAINAMAPTSCQFSGDFVFAPGYKQTVGAIDVDFNNKRLNRSNIRSTFFKG